MHVLVELTLLRIASPDLAERVEALVERDPAAARAALHLLAQERMPEARILSAPTLLAADGETARFSVARRGVFPTTTGIDAAGRPVVAVERRILEELVIEARPLVERGALELRVAIDSAPSGETVEELDWDGVVPLPGELRTVGLADDLVLVVSTAVGADDAAIRSLVEEAAGRRDGVLADHPGGGDRARRRAIEELLGPVAE